MNPIQIKKALISVSDKTGVVELAKTLYKKNISIISTGGTRKLLSEHDIPSIDITEVTKNPEAFDGRMKSISFQVGSALLYDRSNDAHVRQAYELGIEPIDLVICNLYPFEEVSKKTENWDTLIENIDIGGPTMIRAAAKNHKSVTVLTDPNQYGRFLNELTIDNQINYAARKNFALEAFKLTAHYDSYISKTLTSELEQEIAFPELETKTELRYGENPHQKAFQYSLANTDQARLDQATILQGKALSYNNMLDADAAWKSMCDALHSTEDDRYAVSVIKHLNPCGLALTKEKYQSLEMAWAGDPVSAFGSIIAFSFEVDAKIAEFFNDKFIEILLAPNFTPEARTILARKKNLRLLELELRSPNQKELSYRSIAGSLLIQEEDSHLDCEFQSVTKASFNQDKLRLAQFGIQACKHLKSNAIALVHETDGNFWITGAGMGQPNRLDSLKLLAAPRSREKDMDLSQAIMISDAFFPFRDTIDIANEYDIKYIVQPGGSIRDKEVIEACDEHGMAMIFTGKRHFRH